MISDFGSNMHYADTDATRGVVTILAKNSIYQHTMGNNVSRRATPIYFIMCQKYSLKVRPSFADILEVKQNG